jgi:non-heme chloroperoxidase
MATIKAADGTEIFFKDWGRGKPIVFSHGWACCSDTWDTQMQFLVEKGYRVIAHDRRGHGRSEQSAQGNDMDTYADDLANVIETLGLEGVTLVAHSTGGGEISRYVGRHGTRRVARMVLIAPVTPHLLQTDANPSGVPLAVFDGIRASTSANRSAFFKYLAIPLFGYNRPDAVVSQGNIDEFWREAMQGSVLGQYACVRELSEVDFTSDLGMINVPTLILQGDDDQVVPLELSGRRSAALIKGSTLKIYPGAPHGLYTTHPDEVNEDLLAFLSA